MNWQDKTIFTGDNLHIMRGMNGGSVDLIYLDPPFNSNRNYAAPIGSRAAGAAFKDTWTLSDVDEAEHGELAERSPALHTVIQAAREAHGKPMQAYLIMMALAVVGGDGRGKGNPMNHANVVDSVINYFKNPAFAAFCVKEEINIAIGAKVGRADIVLCDKAGKFCAIAECKKWNDQKVLGRLQLKCYLAASNTRFGLLAVGQKVENWEYCENKGANKFLKINKDNFELGVLNNPPGVFKPEAVGADKPQSTRIWKYATLVLGIGLALSFVMILMPLFKPAEVLPPIFFDAIPAGEFQMGSDASDTESDEQPRHTVYVDSYYIDKYEVTNAKFKQFVDANPQWQKDLIPRKFHNGEYLDLWQGNSYPPDKENHPVVYVSWYAAMAYAKWEGKRLPTEAEWERAARGGLVDLRYTWGNIVDSSKANYGGQVGDTTPVGSYPANDYGLHDMVGNVMEWCLDGYETDFYSRSPRLNPIAGGVLIDIVNNFEGVISRRAVRSGCWYNVPLHVRVADRYGANPNHVSKGRGFRCARSATSSSK